MGKKHVFKNHPYNSSVLLLDMELIDMAKSGQLKDFGKRLALLRKKTGYSLRALAKETGISHRMIAYYEIQGGRAPADVVVKLADALNVTTDELLGRTNGTKKTKPHNQRLLRKLRQVENLSSRDREAVLRMIDGLSNR